MAFLKTPTFCITQGARVQITVEPADAETGNDWSPGLWKLSQP